MSVGGRLIHSSPVHTLLKTSNLSIHSPPIHTLQAATRRALGARLTRVSVGGGVVTLELRAFLCEVRITKLLTAASPDLVQIRSRIKLSYAEQHSRMHTTTIPISTEPLSPIP